MLGSTDLRRMGLAAKAVRVEARNIDVALSGNFVGSQTQVAACLAPSARSFPFLALKTMSFIKGGTHDGFEDLRRWSALFGN